MNRSGNRRRPDNFSVERHAVQCPYGLCRHLGGHSRHAERSDTPQISRLRRYQVLDRRAQLPVPLHALPCGPALPLHSTGGKNVPLQRRKPYRKNRQPPILPGPAVFSAQLLQARPLRNTLSDSAGIAGVQSCRPYRSVKRYAACALPSRGTSPTSSSPSGISNRVTPPRTRCWLGERLAADAGKADGLPFFRAEDGGQSQYSLRPAPQT